MKKRGELILLASGLGLAVSLAGASAQEPEQADTRSPVQRPREHDRSRETPPPTPSAPAVFPYEYRTIDGIGNNTMHPDWGGADIAFLRLVPADYTDGVGSPAGAGRPSARLVSNLVAAQDGADIPNTLGLSDFIWQWGQFIDHDIDETPITSPGEAFDILVPLGDVWFDPDSTGSAVIPLDRSAWMLVGGVREQINLITAYIDASNVYGSEEARANELRALDGTGKLKTSNGNLLPFNLNGFANAPDAGDQTLFLAGDIRVNEQVGLTAMHTLFMREHNRIAERIAYDHPQLTGDEIYEGARAMVAAELQAITYNEFLPKLLGPGALPPYQGYRPLVNAGISNVFANAAYRVGHTMLSSQILRVDAAGQEIAAGHLDLAAAFFTPSEIIDHGIDPLLRGLAAQRSQDIDTFVIDDVRNFLFGPPGSGGLDLASLNIQRGRDHGLPSYNAVRVAFGLPAAAGFTDVNPDPAVAQRLASAYTGVDDIDPWVGMLAELHRPGAFVGETLFRVLRDQFLRVRDGDRFWYEIYLPQELARRVSRTSLAEIIRSNTDIGAELADDVFTAGLVSPCAADLDGNGTVDATDLSRVIAAWGPCSGCNADLNGDGVINNSDLALVLAAWGPC